MNFVSIFLFLLISFQQLIFISCKLYSYNCIAFFTQCVAADRGLKIQDNKLTYILGSHPAYWKGGQAVAGSPICGTTPQPANVSRSIFLLTGFCAF